jgi:hypothetical protein
LLLAVTAGRRARFGSTIKSNHLEADFVGFGRDVPGYTTNKGHQVMNFDFLKPANYPINCLINQPLRIPTVIATEKCHQLASNLLITLASTVPVRIEAG